MNIFSGNKTVRKLFYIFKRLLRSIGRTEPIRVFKLPQYTDHDCIEAAYIINLDRQASRWKTFKREASRLRIAGADSLLDFCHRLSAVDGKYLLPSDTTVLVAPTYTLESQYYVDPDPRLLSKIREKTLNIKMTREETAVALSHIKAWKQIVTDKVSYALVLEDDVFFEKSFASQLNRSWEELPNKRKDGFRFDILYLSYREVDRGADKIIFSPNLRRLIRGYWWLSGYILSYSAACRLLDLLPVIGPVDLWINQQFSKFDVYSTPDSIISQRTDLQSDNRYSILPLLSQIGVQSDKTHLILEQTKGKTPVFGIGFGRKRSAILEIALSMLGYRCLNDKYDQLSDKINQLINDKLPLLFDAYVGNRSITRAFKQLDKLYPNAVFVMPHILTEDNILSLQEYDEVIKYFSDRKNKLLVLNAQNEDNWQILCEFLSCKIPVSSFPANIELRELPKSWEYIPLKQNITTILEHDVHPWIVPIERLAAFGILSNQRKYGNRAGTFKLTLNEEFALFDNSHWTALENSFPSNLASFCRENINILSGYGCEMKLVKQRRAKKEYLSGSLVHNRLYQYGRFEVIMKPAKAAGVVTAFFLHRNNPWQEIDIEILGRDTTKVLFNVYFNPGNDGTNYNYGNRGTPVIVDLSFDASEDFHRYAIEWEPHEIRWFVDDELVHVRSTWEPTQVPNLPMEVYCSIWSPRSIELAGELKDDELPLYSYIKNICISSWLPNS